MRIAFVVHDYHQEAGHSRYVSELARRFSRAHEVHVFANVFRESPEWSIQYHHVPAWRATALTSIFSFVVPATLAVGGGFDIVHAQGACLLHCDVATAHICQPAWHRSRLAAEGRLRWKDHLFAIAVTPLERTLMSARHASRIISISERLQRDLAEHYGREERVTVIHHGVALDRFSPENRPRFRREARARLGLSEGAVAFLFVGDLRKGAEPAIRAMALCPRKEAVLVAVSRTPPGRYRGLARSLGVDERVLLCPATAQIEAYYAAADALLFPTPYDAFGMVISEAMASGLPVVTSRGAGAAELVRHGLDGWLLDDPFDPREIVRHVQCLASDAVGRERMGSAARRSIERQTWDRVALETMSVYEEVLASRAAAATRS